MNDKGQILNELADIFSKWEELLASLNEEQITETLPPSNWNMKDVVAHLWSWQQASVARMEAALYSKEPEYPGWWKRFDPDPEGDVDRTNAWLYEANRGKSWQNVYSDWKTQFQHYLELSRQLPEEDLLEPGRYTWMGDSALLASSLGTLEHHQEHYDSLRAWLLEHGAIKSGT